MRGRFQPPLLVTAAALLGLIAILATLQYRWLGQISAAERDRMTSTLNVRAAAFAEDFDRELTLAYSVFQLDLLAGGPGDSVAARLGRLFDRWQAAARYPKLVRACYVASHGGGRSSALRRFDSSTGALAPAEWPEAFAGIRQQIETQAEETVGRGRIVLRTMAGPLWETVPALLVPGPLAVVTGGDGLDLAHGAPSLSYIVLLLDRDYITQEILPALARQHFGGTTGDLEYQLAVVSAEEDRVLYESIPGFRTTARTDASADLFGLRAQEFARLAADVRRFVASAPPGTERLIVRDARSLSLAMEGSASPAGQRPAASAMPPRAAITGSGPKWRLLVVHPSGSLEAAVASARRRNLLISTGVLGVLAASIGLLLVSTRRSQELARQQMEFVAAVSHELRTPLAVIRSAGDNLADGTVRDEAQMRRYGALVRSEGRRLTGMVEQILEFSGIHSGQRTLETAPVALNGIIAGVLKSSAPLVEAAGIRVELDIPPDVPPVAGDESALRRVFQNLVDNAVKYGERGGWIGIIARREGSEVSVTVRDRGIGIAPWDQTRIFEPFYRAPDVVAAQIQGAGLGLSLVHRIVDAHRGRITVKSTTGEGSAFTVHLPAATARTTAAELVPPDRAESPHPTTT